MSAWSPSPEGLADGELTRDEGEVALREVHALPAFLRGERCSGRADRAAHNRLVDVGVGVGVDSNTAGRMAPEGDALGIATKGRNVVFDPLRREADVLEAEILLVERGAVGEAEDVDALRAYVSGELSWDVETRPEGDLHIAD